MINILAMILAGGKGERLHPLTIHQAKPAVPFGGIYRIIDFTLSNCVNSGIRKIVVLPQYKSLSLDRHIHQAWNFFSRELDEYIISVPPQQRVGDKWYQGTADAIFQNIYSIGLVAPAHLLVLAGDHIYKMNYAKMLQFHQAHHADATVAVIEMPRQGASAFGVVEVGAGERIVGFEEKPLVPKSLPGQPDTACVSMGVYLFKTKALLEHLKRDALQDTSHDFGKDIIPEMMKTSHVCAYRFHDENNKAAKYWRDIGTIEAYYAANMDLVSVDPQLNLYDDAWPIRTYQAQNPPAKFVFAEETKEGRLGHALDSIVAPGCILSGGRVQNSVLSPNVRVHSYSDVTDSILMEHVNIGRHCRIRRAIIEKGVNVPPHTEIGYDLEEDQKHYLVTASGLVVVAQDMKIPVRRRSAPPLPVPPP